MATTTTAGSGLRRSLESIQSMLSSPPPSLSSPGVASPLSRTSLEGRLTGDDANGRLPGAGPHAHVAGPGVHRPQQRPSDGAAGAAGRDALGGLPSPRLATSVGPTSRPDVVEQRSPRSTWSDPAPSGPLASPSAAGWAGGAGGGGPIGSSPQSAFTSVRSRSSSGAVARGPGSSPAAVASRAPARNVWREFDPHGGAGRGDHRGGRRETSLLVSPVPPGGPSPRLPPVEEAPGSPAAEEEKESAPGFASVGDGAAARFREMTSPTATGGGTPTLAGRMSAATAPRTSAESHGSRHGRDPTPYHYRSAGASPQHGGHRGQPGRHADHGNQRPLLRTSGSDEHSGSQAHSASSSRSGLDPPAKSPFPTTILGHVRGRAGPDPYETARATPNADRARRDGHQGGHGGDGHGNHHDESAHCYHGDGVSTVGLACPNDALDEASHVTAATVVRTPVARRSPRGGAGGRHGTAAPGPVPSPGSRAATPGRTDLAAVRDGLSDAATAAVRRLERVWDAVGVGPEDRAAQLAELVDSFQVLCDGKVAEEEALLATFEREIESARDECDSIRRAFGEEDPTQVGAEGAGRDPSSSLAGGGPSLQHEYEELQSRLESLRTARDEARRSLLECRGRAAEGLAALRGTSAEEACASDELADMADVEADLTEGRRMEFARRADGIDSAVDARCHEIVGLVLACQGLIRELEIEPPSVDIVGRSLDDAKIMQSLEDDDDVVAQGGWDQQQQDTSQAGRTLASLRETPTCVGISDSALERLSDRLRELKGEKHRRRVLLGEMGQKINNLWNMLRIPDEDRAKFTGSIRGLGSDTLSKGRAEVQRLEGLKGEMIGKLVKEQRRDIEGLWAETGTGPVERAEFAARYDGLAGDDVTSAVLVEHEEYAERLRARLRKMRPILDLISRREAILEERTELELLQRDPGRLTGRGASKQLMREEKMGNRVKRDLPKVTKALERALWEWHRENRPADGDGGADDPSAGHFAYEGVPYLETMRVQEEEWRDRRERAEEERQRKKEEERTAAASKASSFGYSTYSRLPGKKRQDWSSGGAASSGAGRPRSASNARSGSSTRAGGRGGGGGLAPRPLGDHTRHNRPPSRPRNGPGAKKAAGGGAGYRPASAPRMRF